MFHWRVIYSDGFLDQFSDGLENKYKDIQRDKLIGFELWRDDNLLHSLSLKENQKLIYRRRVFVKTVDFVKVSESFCFIIGYLEDGKKYLTCIHENGKDELKDDDLILMPCEE
jgi:hypothetical protein